MQARLLLIGVALMGAAIGSAQSFEEKIANVALLQNKDIQDELGITESLRNKLNTYADEFNAKANKAQEDFQKKNPNATAASPELIKQIEGYQKTMEKNVLGALSKAQLKRLSEITLQASGFPAMMDPNVAKQIGLTDAQVKKLRDAFQVSEQNIQRLVEKEQNKIRDKYNKQYKTEEESKAAQESVNRESAEAMKRIEPEIVKQRNAWLATFKKTVKAIQINRFEALLGKPFKPAG